MHKESYVLLLVYSSSNEIRIRRVEISKQGLKRSLFRFAFIWFVCAVGFSIISLSSLAFNSSNSLQTQIMNLNKIEESKNETTTDMGGPFRESREDLLEESNLPAEETSLNLEEIVTRIPKENVPDLWPREDRINNEFGFRRSPFGGRTYEFHEGIDIDGERGDPVFASGAGIVVKAGWQGGYGNMVEIEHYDGLTTRYGHLSKVLVQLGEKVSKGQQIGLVGSTGRSTGPHLHYELRLEGKAIDPRKLLPAERAIISR